MVPLVVSEPVGQAETLALVQCEGVREGDTVALRVDVWQGLRVAEGVGVELGGRVEVGQGLPVGEMELLEVPDTLRDVVTLPVLHREGSELCDALRVSVTDTVEQREAGGLAEVLTLGVEEWECVRVTEAVEEALLQAEGDGVPLLPALPVRDAVAHCDTEAEAVAEGAVDTLSVEVERGETEVLAVTLSVRVAAEEALALGLAAEEGEGVKLAPALALAMLGVGVKEACPDALPLSLALMLGQPLMLPVGLLLRHVVGEREGREEEESDASAEALRLRVDVEVGVVERQREGVGVSVAIELAEAVAQALPLPLPWALLEGEVVVLGEAPLLTLAIEPLALGVLVWLTVPLGDML